MTTTRNTTRQVQYAPVLVRIEPRTLVKLVPRVHSTAQKAEGLQLVASFSFNSFFLKLEIAEGFQKQIVLVPHEKETIRKDVGILKL